MTKRPSPPTAEQIERQRLDQARAEWVRARRGTPRESAMSAAWRAFDGLRGVNKIGDLGDGDDFYVDVRRGEESVSVAVRLRRDWESVVTNPDDANETVIPLVPSVELTWSSTGRTPSAALAAVALYRDVMERAAEAESGLIRARAFEYRIKLGEFPVPGKAVTPASEPARSGS